MKHCLHVRLKKGRKHEEIYNKNKNRNRRDKIAISYDFDKEKFNYLTMYEILFFMKRSSVLFVLEIPRY